MLYSKIIELGAHAEGKLNQAKPLLILHGFLGMSDNWKSLGTQYATKGYQVHLLDIRNHGRSFHSEEFNYQVMAQDVLNYCNKHQLAKVALIGHSMGGKIAMLFATKYPEKVEKLVVADIGPKYYPPHHQEILAGLNAVNFDSKPDRANVEKTLLPFIPDFGTRQFIMKNLYWKTPDQLDFRFNLNAFNHNINEIGTELSENAKFEKPTLFIRGGNSKYILDTDFPTIASHFPNYIITTIPNVGHWLHAENPEQFFKETAAFLK